MAVYGVDVRLDEELVAGRRGTATRCLFRWDALFYFRRIEHPSHNVITLSSIDIQTAKFSSSSRFERIVFTKAKTVNV